MHVSASFHHTSIIGILACRPGLCSPVEECRLHDGSSETRSIGRAAREERGVPIYLAIGQMLIAVALISVILLQVHGGGLGGIFGQPDSVYRTRRGVEKTLFRLTIALAIFFVILAMLIVSVS